MSAASEPSPQVRLTVLGVVVMCLFAALFARLWFLQVIDEPSAEAQAATNSVRIVYTPAPRGEILDRQGNVLVGNQASEVVSITEQNGAHEPGVIAQLALVLNTPYATLEQKVNDGRYGPYDPVPLAVNVQPSTVVYLRENASEFPNVDVQASAERTYPYGSGGANILGYVGQITAAELTPARKHDGYQPGDEIGKTGVEASFESVLRGQPGITKLQVNSKGQVLGVLASRPPVPGDNVWLNIDINDQMLAEQSLAQGIAAARVTSDHSAGGPGHDFYAPGGAVVILNPENGAVLALATNPTYNPADFVGGISEAKFQQYLSDPDHPLLDRTIQGVYAPGSTFKLATALAGLQAGLISPTTYFNDRGYLQVGVNPCSLALLSNQAGCFYNDNRQIYGEVDLQQALTVSSDAYFYSVGEQFWNQYKDNKLFGPDGLQNGAHEYGFGSATGIDLPNEAAGLVPDAASRAKEYQDFPKDFQTGSWFTGDNVNTAVGQGEVGVTPLQLADAYSAFANGGILWVPQIALKVTNAAGQTIQNFSTDERSHITFQPAWQASMLAGFEGAVADPKGTAVAAFSGFPLAQYPVAGKTGTAQVSGKDPTSVFASFAPATNPQYTVVSMMEQSGYGADASAPVVRRIYDGLFNLGSNQVQLQSGGKD
ncbi:MAG: penicillin-binding protein 2 [Acidimicrobiales bacterium]